MIAGSLFPVTVIGPVIVRYPEARSQGRPPSAGDQYVMAALVAAGPDGLTLAQLDSVRPSEGPVDARALRMALSRLRQHLPTDAVPDATDRRYHLARPASEVDAWRLAALVDDRTLRCTDAELRHLMRPVEPYEGLQTSDLLEESIARIRADQRRLLVRLGHERPDVLRGPLVEHLGAHLELDPCNEELIEVVVENLSIAGRRREALGLIARVRREFLEAGLSMGRALDRLEVALLDGERGTVATQTTRRRPARRRVAAELWAHSSRPFAGRDDLLVRVGERCPPLGDRRPVIVTGASGAGKTRLLAELAQRAHDHDVHVCYLAPATPGVDAAFGPVVAAMPSLGDSVRSVLEGATDPETRRSRLWAVAVDAIARDAEDRPVLLLVDDCQWLDSHTMELVLHLCSSPPIDVTVVAAGRDDQVGAENWRELRQVFARRSAAAVEVLPLDRDGVCDLVRDERPDLTALQIAAIGDRVFAASGGLPGVAIVLIDSLPDDPFTDRPFELADVGDLALDAVVGRLGSGARDLGVVASVLGLQFELRALAHVAQATEDDVLTALDVLIQQRLVIERSAVDFALAHVLVQAAFLRTAPKWRVAELNRRAAAWFADDPHRRARHLAASAPLAGSELAGEALVHSALVHAEIGRVREAVVDFAHAHRVGARCTPADLAAYARALDLVGSSVTAAEIRRRAVDDALQQGDHALALCCAVSGLPESEPIDGDRSIIDNLMRLDPAEMSAPDRWLYSLHAARQLAIVGRAREAVEHADRAVATATTALERLRSGLVRRFVTSATSPPIERLTAMEQLRRESRAVTDVALRAELLVLTAVDSYENMDVAGAIDAIDELDSLGIDVPNIRLWHAGMLRAMFATDAGDLSATDTWRRRALEVSQRTGIREGHNAFLGAAFIDAWRDGRLAQLLTAMGQTSRAPSDEPAARSALQLAVTAVVHEASGEPDAAQRVAQELARMVLEAPAAQGTSALAMVSSILACGEPALAERVRDLLARRGSSMIVLGAGAASLGPAPRYVAMLTPDASERRAALADAAQVVAACAATAWLPVLDRDQAATR